MPWLITSFGLPVGRHLIVTLLTLWRHRITASLTMVGLGSAVAGYGAALLVHRSGSRRRSPS
ncbi:MAG: hypothetical protein ACLPVF_12515 [Acidimicrobiales bacterium]